MKKILLSAVLFSNLFLLSFVTIIKPVSAQTLSFRCMNGPEGKPTTMAVPPIMDPIPMITWTRGTEKISAQERCNQVSARFQNAYQKGILKNRFIHNGIMNKQKVICVAEEVNGPCIIMLFTLASNDDPVKILNHLKNYRAKGPLQQSGDGTQKIYIDMNLFLQEAQQPSSR